MNVKLKSKFYFLYPDRSLHASEFIMKQHTNAIRAVGHHSHDCEGSNFHGIKYSCDHILGKSITKKILCLIQPGVLCLSAELIFY